jgi:hypothetical protein
MTLKHLRMEGESIFVLMLVLVPMSVTISMLFSHVMGLWHSFQFRDGIIYLKLMPNHIKGSNILIFKIFLEEEI